MKYLLDTDTCIYLMNSPSPRMIARLREIGSSDIAISSITQAELYFGASHSKQARENQKKLKNFLKPFDCLDFDTKGAQAFGEIKESLVKKGKIIGLMGILIASIAAANKATIVTNNQKDFKRIRGLKLENWL